MNLKSTVRFVGKALIAVYIGRPNGVRRRLWRRIVHGRSAQPATDDVPVPAPVEVPQAPAGYVDLCGLDELPEGEIGEFFVGELPVALARVDGVVHALGNVCPHAGGPLGDGTLDDATVTCPWHGWAFDVRTGVCALDPAITVPTYDVRVEAGRILLKL